MEHRRMLLNLSKRQLPMRVPWCPCGSCPAMKALRVCDSPLRAAKGEAVKPVLVLRLGRLMKERGISGEELAKQIGCTETNLSLIKMGRKRSIRFNTLSKLCQTLECKPGDLLDYVDRPEKGDVVLVASDEH